MSEENDWDIVTRISSAFSSKKSRKSSVASYKSARSSFHRSMTMDERQMMHPLQREDPMGNLLYQSTYTGMDMTMRFDWLKCRDAENSTWIGGFNWEC